jgi:hypothetical protein
LGFLIEPGQWALLARMCGARLGQGTKAQDDADQCQTPGKLADLIA